VLGVNRNLNSELTVLVIAMMRHRLNETEVARVALSRAALLIHPMTDRYEPAGEVDAEWHDWVIPRLVFNEAQELFGGAQ
jgi:hypothetical protein